MSYIQHIVKGRIRWDQVALTVYGDVNKIEPILIANPSIPIEATIPAGTKINIPVIEQAEIISNNIVPPWKL